LSGAISRSPSAPARLAERPAAVDARALGATVGLWRFRRWQPWRRGGRSARPRRAYRKHITVGHACALAEDLLAGGPAAGGAAHAG
jgi:hypothetical protein